MFKEHQPKIASYARQGAREMARVAQFVVCTVQNPLTRVPGDMSAVERGDRSSLYGWKLGAVQAWRDDAQSRFDRLEYEYAIPRASRDAEMAMLPIIADWQGFGLVKAGFMLQLCYGLSGCIDTHNLTRFDIPRRSFDNWKFKKERARQLCLARYCDTVERCGGTELLWNEWCEHVAAQPYYDDARHVSRLHVEAILETETEGK